MRSSLTARNTTPLQNRVLPTGDIVAIPARGTLTGNRGIIHGPDRVLGAARWSHHAWICCTLDWQGRQRDVMTGRKWTELFFLDEAVALAAGHRPCGYCRRPAYRDFVAAWGETPSAKAMDKALHKARGIPRQRIQQTYREDIRNLPAGAFVLWIGVPHLVRQTTLHGDTPDGYLAPARRPATGDVTVLTPQPTVTALSAGYRPALHTSAAL